MPPFCCPPSGVCRPDLPQPEEGGCNIRFLGRGFVEPQDELAHVIVFGDDHTAINSVKVRQDDFETPTGRVGLRGGFKFPENKGRASYV